MALTPQEEVAWVATENQRIARADRLLASQRATVDSAKLVSTFVLALAATLVGTALQVPPRAGAELVALVLVAVSALAALIVILLDSLDIPNFTLHELTKTNDFVRQDLMQAVVDRVIDSNDKTCLFVKIFALFSVGMSTAAGVVSGVALMLK